MKVIGFLPLRAGSKGIPHKNRNSFLGKPLYKWVLDEMLTSKIFTEIWISTDDDFIIKEEKENPKVNIHYRSELVSEDCASTEEVIEEFLKERTYNDKDVIILVQATNPFLTRIDLNNAFSDFLKYSICEKNDTISMISVVENHNFLWQQEFDKIKPINYDPMSRKRRQDITNTELYIENGSFYISYIKNINKYHSRLTPEVLPYVMGKESYLEIDDPLDWIICERIRKYLNEIGKK